MKKKLFIIFLLISSCLFADEIKIYAPVAQQMLIDKNNYLRYSSLNMFDDNSDTVYAVTFEEIDTKKPLLEIYFSEPAAFERISIKPGYFDNRYFEKNNRINKLQLQIYNCKNLEIKQEISLQDKMAEQDIYSADKITATKIVIYISSIFPGTKWNDLVISDLNFFLEGNKLPVSFDIGKCVNCTTYRDYEYDDQNRIIHEYVAVGKSGSVDNYYKYIDGKIFVASMWDGQKVTDKDFSIIKVVIRDSDKNMELIVSNNLLVAQKYARNKEFYINQYIYDDVNNIKAIIRICQNSNWSNKYTKYIYNSQGQIKEISDYEDATIYVNRY